MTYGRVLGGEEVQTLDGAAVSHSAELVRGDSSLDGVKAPSSGPTGHLLPKGRRDRENRVGQFATLMNMGPVLWDTFRSDISDNRRPSCRTPRPPS
jgi:hypothetical protein